MGGIFVMPKVDVGGQGGDVLIGMHLIVGEFFPTDEVGNPFCGLRSEDPVSLSQEKFSVAIHVVAKHICAFQDGLSFRYVSQVSHIVK